MAKKYAILPCNGLDKAFGAIAREVALRVVADNGGEIICPVLLNNSPPRYEKTLKDFPLMIVDGCGTRCASKLANLLKLNIARKVLISDEVKKSALKPEDGLSLGPVGLELARSIADWAAEERPEEMGISPAPDFSSPVEYMTFTYDKYLFRVPKDGFFFNENDCWVRVGGGGRARVGVSDYVQQNLSDMTFFIAPEIGSVINQFDESGTVESTKSTMDLISPVSGKIVAVNTALEQRPEIINEDPYEKGWAVELELTDFESDRDLLLDGAAYLEIIKRKVAEGH